MKKVLSAKYVISKSCPVPSLIISGIYPACRYDGRGPNNPEMTGAGQTTAEAELFDRDTSKAKKNLNSSKNRHLPMCLALNILRITIDT